MIPGVPDESTVVFDSSSKGTGTKPGVPDEEKVLLEWGSEKESEQSDKDADVEKDDEETESDSEDIYKYKIKMRKDANKEMKDADNVESENKEKEEMTDAAKVDAEKTVSSNYGDTTDHNSTTTLSYIHHLTYATNNTNNNTNPNTNLDTNPNNNSNTTNHHRTKLDDALYKVLQTHVAELIQTYFGQPAPESSKKQESEKSPEEIMKINREQAEVQQTSK
nr:hypothetical protein [Tanacetum cinerariifolium]